MCAAVRLAVLLGTLAVQFPAAVRAQTPAEWMDPRRRFAVTLPEGWRALTPDEGKTLATRADGRLPVELSDPAPPHLLVFGAVDAWLASGFDGRGLVVAEQPGEPDVGPAGVDAILAHWQSASGAGGPTYDVDAIAAGSVGAEAHPAILARLRATDASASWRRFDAYVPTAGDTLIFGLRWPADAADAGDAAWARLIASIKLARPARGPSRLGNRLLWAVLLGVGIGVLLNVVRKRQRK